MKHLLLILLLLSVIPANAQDTTNEKLLALAPFIGTWKAEVAENNYDVSHYDWILGGKALRIMHSVNDGNMGGITETRSGYEMKDSEVHVWSQFLKNGEWTEKANSTYTKAADAEVRF